VKVSIVIPFYNEEENVVAVLNEVRARQPEAEILGQSAALYYGLHAATGDVLVMMDGDGQNDPADIPALIIALEQGEGDFACGYRKNRQDTWQKKAASRIANAIRRKVLGDGCRDTGCTLKAIRREHVKFIHPFNAMHRFIPALLANAGLRIAEVPANHRPRTLGVSKYTVAGRAWRGLRDLFGVRWLLSRSIRWNLDPHRIPS
jgi:dolichol-phosphate mannosyltransferase